jgi:tetratricopeptide (TPR) repeat protein
MQWVDEATLALLLSLASRVPTAQILIVLTARTAETRQRVAVWETLKKIDRVSLLLRLCLRPFDSLETATLVGRALGVGEGDACMATFVGQLHGETGGNALFLVESLKSLLEQGSLAPAADGRWNLPAADEPLPAPASVQDLIAGRLARLDLYLRAALELVAVSGEDADFPVLSQAAAVGAAAWPSTLPSILEAMHKRGFLVETGLGYRFEHDRVRETVYAAIEGKRRRHLHRQVGLALEALHPERVESLAYHYGCGELWDRAANYSWQAGDRARAVYANVEAAAHYTRAIETAEGLPGPADPDFGFTLRLAREAIYDLLGERTEQVEDLEALQVLAEHLGVEQRADVALRQANYAEVTGDYLSAIAAARTAIDLAQTAGDVGKEAAGYLQWGRILWHEGEYEASRSRLEQSLALSQTKPVLRRLEAASLRNLCIVSQYQSDFDDASIYGEQARRIYHEIGDRQGESDALKNLGTLADYLADYASAEAYYEQALHICREIGYRRGECDMLNNLGIIYDGQGDYSRAKAHYERALHISHEIGYRQTWVVGNLGTVFSALGCYDDARACYEESLAICREIGSRQSECVALANLSLVFHHLGDDKAAQDYGRQTLHLAQDLGDRYVESYALNYLGNALTGLGQWLKAVEMYRQAMAIRRELGSLNLAVESLAGLSRVFLAQGDLTQAQAQVEEILSYLEDGTLEGTDEPFQVYLTCYRVLCAGRDPRAEGILANAHRLLQERAARIEDKGLRWSFLDSVVAHREIIAAYQEVHACQLTVRLARADVSASRSPRDAEWVEVTWTVAVPEDDEIAGKVARRRHRLLRLLRQAAEQGAVPTVADLAAALDAGERTVKRDLAALRAEGHEVCTRGTRVSKQ